MTTQCVASPGPGLTLQLARHFSPIGRISPLRDNFSLSRENVLQKSFSS